MDIRNLDLEEREVGKASLIFKGRIMIEIKTYKNYVGGKYVRSESGKTFTLNLKMILLRFH